MATPKGNVIKALAPTPNKRGFANKSPSAASHTFSFGTGQKPGCESDESDELEQVFDELNGQLKQTHSVNLDLLKLLEVEADEDGEEPIRLS